MLQASMNLPSNFFVPQGIGIFVQKSVLHGNQSASLSTSTSELTYENFE